ncbi:NAD(P)-dependent oxidoreductase [Deinococcus fonticola]|uniref:NAD(P)-dependent oxidoreductase n=1 Tax=Deinococcus fonticola TaxID=2528713 RepID=UPI00107508F6|nr:NAD(P)-dependent oxidoreductase [Deinococcus fonticola]
MRVLVPQMPDFRALSVPNVELDFYARGSVPAGEAVGAVLWMTDADTRDTLLKVPGLQWVLTLTAGIDHVQGHLPAGVKLFNANALHDRAVAVHVVTGMLAAMRGLHRFRDAQRAGHWMRVTPPESNLHTLDGLKVVLWGYGHIGRIVDDLLAPFGVTTYAINSKTEPDLLEYRLREADWVVLLLPSTEQTRGVVNAELLGKLKRGAWLSNQGRGGLIVTADLLDALNSGQLGGAVLDVTDPEPLPEGHPLFAQENVLLTPHVASTTSDLLARGAAYTRDFLLDLTQGRDPDGLVKAGRIY